MEFPVSTKEKHVYAELFCSIQIEKFLDSDDQFLVKILKDHGDFIEVGDVFGATGTIFIRKDQIIMADIFEDIVE